MRLFHKKYHKMMNDHLFIHNLVVFNTNFYSGKSLLFHFFCFFFFSFQKPIFMSITNKQKQKLQNINIWIWMICLPLCLSSVLQRTTLLQYSTYKGKTIVHTDLQKHITYQYYTSPGLYQPSPMLLMCRVII